MLGQLYTEWPASKQVSTAIAAGREFFTNSAEWAAGRKLVIAGAVTAYLGYKIYQLVPHFPKDLGNASRSRQIRETIVRIVFRIAVTAERWGIAEDSTYLVRRLLAFASHKNPAALDIPGEHSVIADVPVIIFRKDPNARNQKAIVYFHGGGYALGNAKAYSPFTSLLAKTTDTVVISVDYRLAPKYPYPAAVDDCVNVTRAVFDSAEAMGIDRNRIALVGDSAGANLALVVSLQLSSNENYRLKAQVLFSVTTLSPGIVHTPSALRYNHLYPIPADWYLTKFAGQKYTRAIESSVFSRRYASVEDTQRVGRLVQMSSLPKDLLDLIKDGTPMDIDASGGLDKATVAAMPPELKEINKLALNGRHWLLLLENDNELRKMPPSFFSICEYDMRRDEGLLFFAKLRSLGIPVVMSYLPKAEHIEPVINVVAGSKPTAAARKGFEEAVAYLNEKL